ncbi:MAG: efflux RND transporter periplasmic adaptor subunit [Chitinophagaceae bacterium]
MKSSYIVNWLVVILMMVLVACKDKPSLHVHTAHSDQADTGLADLLQPVNSQVIANVRTVLPQQGTHIYNATVQGAITYDSRYENSIAARVSGRIEKLYIKYNYQPVKKGQLIMEVYSPDLAAAQRELLLIARSGNDERLLSASRQKLLLLGMPAEQVQRVIATGNILYRIPVYSNAEGFILDKTQATAPAPVGSITPAAPAGDDMNAMAATGVPSAKPNTSPTPVLLREGQYVTAGQSLFTIYRQGNLIASLSLQPVLASAVKKGTRVILYTAEGMVKNGTVGIVEPVIQNGLSFTVARIYLQNGRSLQPGQLITAAIPVVYEGGWWLPKKALWQSGNKAFIFRKENGVVKAMAVKTGVSAEGMVQVLTNIAGWQVADNAAYLVDSESFIKETTNQ